MRALRIIWKRTRRRQTLLPAAALLQRRVFPGCCPRLRVIVVRHAVVGAEFLPGIERALPQLNGARRRVQGERRPNARQVRLLCIPTFENMHD